MRDFDRAFAAERPKLLSLALMLTRGNRDLAEDLVQDCAVRALAKYGAIVFTESLGSYLRQALRNAFGDHLRAQAVRNRVHAELARVDGVSDRHFEFDFPPGLAEAVGQLPEKYSTAVTLRYRDELTDAELVRATGLNRPQVRNHIRRGLVRLHQKMAQYLN